MTSRIKRHAVVLALAVEILGVAPARAEGPSKEETLAFLNEVLRQPGVRGPGPCGLSGEKVPSMEHGSLTASRFNGIEVRCQESEPAVSGHQTGTCRLEIPPAYDKQVEVRVLAGSVQLVCEYKSNSDGCVICLGPNIVGSTPVLGPLVRDRSMTFDLGGRGALAKRVAAAFRHLLGLLREEQRQWEADRARERAQQDKADSKRPSDPF